MKIALITAMILLVISPAIGQESSALGLTPGSVAFTSGNVGSYMDSAAESGTPISGHLGLAPGSETFTSCQLGMAVGSKTKCEQMELASSETSLLEKLGYSPLEIPTSEQTNLAPEKRVGTKTKCEQMELASSETSLLEKLGYSPLEIPTSEQANLAPETRSRAEMLFSGEESESSAVGLATGAEIPTSEQTNLAPEKRSRVEMLFSGEESESSAVGLATGAEIPASGQGAAQRIRVPTPEPQKCQSGDVSLASNLCRIERLGLVNYYHNMEE